MFLLWTLSEGKERKCRLLFLSSQELEESKLLGSSSEEEGAGGDGGQGGSGSSGEDETSGGGEGGGGHGLGQEEDWLSHSHAQQADSHGDSE